jgi:excisionase family DNA binding protein
MSTTDECISTAEAADALGITRQRVLQLIAAGRLKAKKFASVYMIRRIDLSAVEDRPHGRPPKSTPATQNAAIRAGGASNGASTGKKKGGKK